VLSSFSGIHWRSWNISPVDERELFNVSTLYVKMRSVTKFLEDPDYGQIGIPRKGK
jgi:hypothetical protein